jgi:hypothetical protein
MAEAFVAMVALSVAILVSMGVAIGIVAVQAAWRDWQRERASWNCEGRSHRLEGVGQRPRPRF